MAVTERVNNNNTKGEMTAIERVKKKRRTSAGTIGREARVDCEGLGLYN